MQRVKTRLASLLFILSAVQTACASRAPHSQAVPPRLTHGISVGQVSGNAVVVWGRCSADGYLGAALSGAESSATYARTQSDDDWTAVVRLAGLQPDRPYEVRVWCASNRDGRVPSNAALARFRTAPPAAEPHAVRFAWSGDVGGQNVCRDANEGYPIFATLEEQRPDLFIALGDMIYADDPCLGTGRYHNAQEAGPPASTDLATFREHWRYNYADPHFQSLRAAVPYFPVWDDHEIRNDAGPLDDRLPSAPDRPLLPMATRAFLEYQPLPRAEPPRLYHSLRWGAHLELFFLDTRQYRDLNAKPDVGATAKSLLGAEQRSWFEKALAASDATWKVVVSSVPLSIPTGMPGRRDGWASYHGDTGFAREAGELLRAARDAGVRNLVWITTDVHFATGFRCVPFEDDPSFVVYELVCGPLNAGVFPQRTVDPSLHPERFYFWGPPTPESIQSFAEAKRWFNFAVVDIDEAGDFALRIVNARGETVVERRLPRQPEVAR